jgi:MFS family permease
MPAPKKLAAVAGFRPMHRQVLLLVVAQAFFQTASTIVITIGALVGARVAPNPQFATAPIAAMFLGTVLTMLPASHFMARFGRKKGFVAGALLGVLGGLASAWGVHARSLLVLSAGTLLIGAYTRSHNSTASRRPRWLTNGFGRAPCPGFLPAVSWLPFWGRLSPRWVDRCSRPLTSALS